MQPESKTTPDKSLAEQLYEMKCNDDLEVGGYTVRRVPGGWIYLTLRGQSFVPFSNEFQPKKEIPDDLPF